MQRVHTDSVFSFDHSGSGLRMSLLEMPQKTEALFFDLRRFLIPGGIPGPCLFCQFSGTSSFCPAIN